ncbi:Panacea domain-containing protein [Methylobacterium oryzae]|uniref:Panacea domain-containing protein n=1 Tax=Methylobacterium oryzae TaxID=334852 RepID=UPI002F2E582B
MKPSFGHKPVDIAKWFINTTDRASGDAITHLKVQKLIYYAQAWSIAHYDKPLFDEDLEAWAHGPVAVSVWDQFKDYGYDAIPEQKLKSKFESKANAILRAVQDKYGIYTAKKLESMTHKEPPWLEARGDLPELARCNNKITKTAMRDFFRAKIAA